MISFRGIPSLKEIHGKVLQKQNLNFIFENHQQEGSDLLLNMQEKEYGCLEAIQDPWHW